MIRIKTKHRTVTKLRKISALDSMRFMQKGQPLRHEAEEGEEGQIIDSESSQEEIILKRAQVSQLANLVENTSLTSRNIKQNNTKKILPPFFREVQKATKSQVQLALVQKRAQQKVQTFLDHQNEPFRKKCE